MVERVTQIPDLHSQMDVAEHVRDFHSKPGKKRERKRPIQFHNDLHETGDPYSIPHVHEGTVPVPESKRSAKERIVHVLEKIHTRRRIRSRLFRK